MTDDKRCGYPEGRMVPVAVDEVDEPEPKPGDLDDDLLTDWHVLDGVAREWRLVAVYEPTGPTLMLRREIWITTTPAAPFWAATDRSLALSTDASVKLMALLTHGARVTTLALCESEALVLRPDQLYRFEVGPGCARCAELAKAGAQ